MKFLGLFFTVLIFCTGSIKAQNKAEYPAIEEKALEYMQAWYQGDSELMSKAIHPQMAKKVVFDTGHKNGAIAYLSARDLLTQTKRKRPESFDAQNLKKYITILDVYYNTATVKAESPNWVDYLHLAKISGEWKIVNILWELKMEDL